jgi:L-histidine Nalpha-methyltransferase
MPDGYQPASAIVREALAGLSQSRKTLPAKLFYDDEGCRLFGEITRLPEYYVTRTEHALLAEVAPQLSHLRGVAMVEYGASDEAKAALVLEHVAASAYVPIDVAGPALDALAARMAATHPDLAVYPIVADFLAPLALPKALRGSRCLGFFPGSTIGNLDPEAAKDFLLQARQTLGRDAQFLIGADLRKDPRILVPAYNDAQGVTAAFNLNLLVRLNREAGADFDVASFRHDAVWNERHGRIEMHLESTRPQTVTLGGVPIAFGAGETIHTENSYKHTVAGFEGLAASAGWRSRAVWTDPDSLFSLHLLE